MPIWFVLQVTYIIIWQKSVLRLDSGQCKLQIAQMTHMKGNFDSSVGCPLLIFSENAQPQLDSQKKRKHAATK